MKIKNKEKIIKLLKLNDQKKRFFYSKNLKKKWKCRSKLNNQKYIKDWNLYLSEKNRELLV